jgi:hypothetical protein
MTAYESAMKARLEREWALNKVRIQRQKQLQAIETWKRENGREPSGLSLWSAHGAVGLRSIL